MARIEDEINQDNVGKISWDEEIFKFCEFKDFEFSAVHIDADFIQCSFEGLDWYGGLFNICNFIECRFENCVFRGSTFADCKFVQCSFKNCRFEEDNMGSPCTFDRSKFYDCTGAPQLD